MGHCGDRVAALVDGELSHEARESMLVHLAQCAECRRQRDEHLRTKALVLGLGSPAPAPDFMSDLLRIAERANPGLPGIRHGHHTGGSGDRGHAGLLSASAFSLVAIIFGSIFALAVVPVAGSSGDPTYTPTFGTLTIEHAVGAPGSPVAPPPGAAGSVVDGLYTGGPWPAPAPSNTAAPAPAGPSGLPWPGTAAPGGAAATPDPFAVSASAPLGAAWR